MHIFRKEEIPIFFRSLEKILHCNWFHSALNQNPDAQQSRLVFWYRQQTSRSFETVIFRITCESSIVVWVDPDFW
jgi:hypothetical protein